MRTKLMGWIERTGNRLPEPVTLFVILGFVVVGVSVVGSAVNWSVPHPTEDDPVSVESLLSSHHVQNFLVDMPEIMGEFPPLAMVLVVMVGIGVADRSGLLKAVLWKGVQLLPDLWLSTAVVLVGICSSVALDAGYVVWIPLGAVLFAGAQRPPLAGLAAAFAGVSAGFSANVILTALDPLLAGFSTPAAQLVDPEYVVHVTDNYYLMVALVPVFLVLGVGVTEWWVEPYLEHNPPEDPNPESAGQADEENDSDPENRTDEVEEPEIHPAGLLGAAVVLVFFLGLVAWMAVPESGILRDDSGSLEPLYHAMVALMTFGFLLPGLVYGWFNGTIRSDRDAVEMIADALGDLGSYILLAFAAAVVLAFVEWSRIGVVLAVTGARFLQGIGLDGWLLVMGILVLSAGLNLFIGSASAQWALLAPVFVPMMMVLGYSPEFTQAVYRVGDSVTNVVTPLLPYFPLIVVFARRHRPEANLGTILALMVPYSLTFALGGAALLSLWMGLDLPLGPGATITLP